MDVQNKISLWQPTAIEVLPGTAKSAGEIAGYARQLSKREQNQIVVGFNAGRDRKSVV